MENKPKLLIKINEYYIYLKTWFWALPVWKRAILSSIIGAIGGSSIIGFFNTYALYYHALCQGFRVPIEGVEYINLAVSLMSFAIIIVSVLGTIILYQTFNVLTYSILRVISSYNILNRYNVFYHLKKSDLSFLH